MGYYMPSPFKDPKTGVFKLRLRVPQDIKHIIGKTMVIKTLDTKDPQIAKVRFVHEYQTVQRDFAAARLQLSEDSSTKLTAADIHILADRWVEASLQRYEQSGDFTRWLVLYEDGDFSPYFSEDDYDLPPSSAPYEKQKELIGTDLDDFLQEIGMRISPHAVSYRALMAAFADRTVALANLCVKRHAGNWTASHEGIQSRTLSVSAKADSTPRISEVFKAYATDKRHTADGGTVEKHLDEYRANLLQFIEICGDLPVVEYRRDHIAEFRTQLLQLPKSKTPEVRTKPISQQIEMAAAQNLPRLSPTTVKKRLRFLGSIFTEAIDRGWITNNPTHGATKKLTARKQSSSLIRGYTRTELPAIFSSPVFTQGYRPMVADYGDAPYWVPIIAYYTGARLEEICQLYTADVIQVEGIWCFNFTNERPDQSIKNGSARLVPLHADLIALGFIEYVQGLPSNGRAFPKLTADKYGKYSTRVSDWLRDYLREKAGVRSDTQPIHGFRHTFKTLSRTAEIAEEWHDTLTGHGGSSIGRDYGQHEVAKAKELIDRLPGVVHHIRQDDRQGSA